MRRAMICVGVMLALLQFWPMMFGHSAESTASAALPRLPHLARH